LNETATDFYRGCHATSSFFLNSCAAIGVIAGAGTIGCGVYETSNKERCPALVEIDENLKNLGN